MGAEGSTRWRRRNPYPQPAAQQPGHPRASPDLGASTQRGGRTRIQRTLDESRRAGGGRKGGVCARRGGEKKKISPCVLRPRPLQLPLRCYCSDWLVGCLCGAGRGAWGRFQGFAASSQTGPGRVACWREATGSGLSCGTYLAGPGAWGLYGHVWFGFFQISFSENLAVWRI